MPHPKPSRLCPGESSISAQHLLVASFPLTWKNPKGSGFICPSDQLGKLLQATDRRSIHVCPPVCLLCPLLPQRGGQREKELWREVLSSGRSRGWHKPLGDHCQRVVSFPHKEHAPAPLISGTTLSEPFPAIQYTPLRCGTRTGLAFPMVATLQTHFKALTRLAASHIMEFYGRPLNY